ncbi:GNAT family N-acetyltransferase [Paenibacillus sp. Marseille-Q4541]|uniref:GNAT family N-acetyltransferase n=1 Tax=Paenibacillus sp. Marseille-Q4541 TaxID=2831522 RepID=UPI001BAD2282|nr:GNAT family N-acetyltransferase [Paenibacillus sp. Marseille-Q4541]
MISIHPFLNLKDIAEFIARINSNPASHVGYAGDNAAEIKDTLLHEFSDLALSDSLHVLMEEELIVGVLGFDVDIELGQAEIWGPFIDDSSVDWHDAADILWSEGTRKLDGRIQTYSGFYNAKNLQARQFMNRAQAVKKQNEMIWAAKCVSNEALSNKVIHSEKNMGYIDAFSSQWTSAFTKLHDASFPGTYYDAKAILGRLSDQHKLWIIASNEILYGYIYTEQGEEHAEATVEYIAVNPVYRKKGIGKRLILHAREDLFSGGVHKITLTVSRNNEQAHSLYEQCGFGLQHEMIFYQLKT